MIRAVQTVVLLCPLALASCGVFDPVDPAPDELARGLVVLYPGGSSEPAELSLWYAGLRAAGIDQAIEIIPWGTPGEDVTNATDYALNRERSASEAHRISLYMDEHPGCPVTLIGYSAGGAIAAFVAEDM